jgi:cation transport ATPase
MQELQDSSTESRVKGETSCTYEVELIILSTAELPYSRLIGSRTTLPRLPVDMESHGAGGPQASIAFFPYISQHPLSGAWFRPGQRTCTQRNFANRTLTSPFRLGSKTCLRTVKFARGFRGTAARCRLFRMTMSSLTLQLENIRCGSCISRVESIIASSVPKGCRGSANLATGLVLLSFPNTLNISKHLPELCSSLSSAGYPCQVLNSSAIDLHSSKSSAPAAAPSSPSTGSSSSRVWRHKDIVVCFGLILLSFAANSICCGPISVVFSSHIGTQGISLVAAVLFGLFPARGILASGFSSLMSGRLWLPLSMDSLVTLSILSQFSVSLYGLLSRSFAPRFHEIVLLLGVIKIGRIIEHEIRAKALAQTSQHTASQPSFCDRRMVGDSGLNRDILKFERVPLDAVVANDVLLVKSGELFPVDGCIITRTSAGDQAKLFKPTGLPMGQASEVEDLTGTERSSTIPVDLSSITGESRDVNLLNGDYVPGGAINLADTPVLLRAVSTGAESEVSLAMESVKRSLLEKSSLQRVADSAAAYLGRISLALAIMSFVLFSIVPQMKQLGARYVGSGAPFLIAGSVLAAACVMQSC